MFLSEPKSVQLAGLLIPAANFPMYWKNQPDVIFKIDFFEWEKFIQVYSCFFKNSRQRDTFSIENSCKVFYEQVAEAQAKEILKYGRESTILFPCVNNMLGLSEILSLLKSTEVTLKSYEKFCSLNHIEYYTPPDCLALRAYSYAEIQIRKGDS